jgi:hypothetical protein
MPHSPVLRNEAIFCIVIASICYCVSHEYGTSYSDNIEGVNESLPLTVSPECSP